MTCRAGPRALHEPGDPKRDPVSSGQPSASRNLQIFPLQRIFDDPALLRNRRLDNFPGWVVLQTLVKIQSVLQLSR